MPRVYHSLLIAALALFFFILKTETVFADPNDFIVTQTPDPFTMDAPNNQNVSITVKKKDSSVYFVDYKYSFVAWRNTPKPAQGNVCTRYNFHGFASDQLSVSGDQKEITAVFPIFRSNECRAQGDQWHFRLWRGDGWDAMSNSDNFIVEKDFTIAQLNGQLITITAENPDVFIGEEPRVIMSNTAPNQDYSFWWEGDTGMPGFRGIAAYYLRDRNLTNPLEVKLRPGSFDFNQPTRKLCVEYGNLPRPPLFNNSCSTAGKFVTFNFKNKIRPTPSGSVRCTIIPPISLNSTVNIKIENVASNTKVFAYAINNDTGNQWPTSQGMSDNTYAFTLPLVDQATAGSYSVAAFTATDPSTNICLPSLPGTAFTVSSNPGPLVPPVVRCTDPNKCASGGGQTAPGCTDNPTNPGIATAIGCIHTNANELTKDVMTFIMGIAGGLAFLLMLGGAFQILTSAGNPETLNAGRERLTNAIIGLLLIIFAVLILQIVGVDILQLPGFGR